MVRTEYLSNTDLATTKNYYGEIGLPVAQVYLSIIVTDLITSPLGPGAEGSRGEIEVTTSIPVLTFAKTEGQDVWGIDHSLGLPSPR